MSKKRIKTLNEMTSSGAVAACPSIGSVRKKKKTKQDKIAEMINIEPKFQTIGDIANAIITDEDIIESYNDNYNRPNQEEKRTNIGMADGTEPAGALDESGDCCDTVKPKKKKRRKKSKKKEMDEGIRDDWNSWTPKSERGYESGGIRQEFDAHKTEQDPKLKRARNLEYWQAAKIKRDHRNSKFKTNANADYRGYPHSKTPGKK